jgi:hypothetical protein
MKVVRITDIRRTVSFAWKCAPPTGASLAKSIVLTAPPSLIIGWRRPQQTAPRTQNARFSDAILKEGSTRKSQSQSVLGSGAAYEPYVERWSRLVAQEFLMWLAISPSARWLDVGGGTEALSKAILAQNSLTLSGVCGYRAGLTL